MYVRALNCPVSDDAPVAHPATLLPAPTPMLPMRSIEQVVRARARLRALRVADGPPPSPDGRAMEAQAQAQARSNLAQALRDLALAHARAHGAELALALSRQVLAALASVGLCEDVAAAPPPPQPQPASAPMPPAAVADDEGGSGSGSGSGRGKACKGGAEGCGGGAAHRPPGWVAPSGAGTGPVPEAGGAKRRTATSGPAGKPCSRLSSGSGQSSHPHGTSGEQAGVGLATSGDPSTVPGVAVLEGRAGKRQKTGSASGKAAARPLARAKLPAWVAGVSLAAVMAAEKVKAAALSSHLAQSGALLLFLCCCLTLQRAQGVGGLVSADLPAKLANHHHGCLRCMFCGTTCTSMLWLFLHIVVVCCFSTY
jgi:hypothetical protein